MAAAVAAQGLRAGRRRSALNEALHELRRPLQAVALAAGPRLGGPAGGRGADRAGRGGARTARPRDQRRSAGARAGRGRCGRARSTRRSRAGRRARGSPEGSLELRWNAGAALRQRRSRRARPGARQPDRQRDRARRPDDRRRRPAARGAPADRRRRLGPRDAAAIAAQQPGRGDRPALRVATATATASAWCGGWRPITAAASPCAAPSGDRSRCSSCRWPRRRPGGRREPARPRARLPRCSPWSPPPWRPAIADGYGSQRGPRLRAAAPGRGRGARACRRAGALGPAEVADALEVRRVPARFVPAGALAATRGKRSGWRRRRRSRPAPTCSPRSCGRRGRGRAERRRSGRAGARSRSRSAAPKRCWPTGAAPAGAKVDVVVTTEPSGSRSRPHLRRRGRRCRCWRSGPGPTGPGPAAPRRRPWRLTKRQALRLIAAESFARKLTLLPEG